MITKFDTYIIEGVLYKIDEDSLIDFINSKLPKNKRQVSIFNVVDYLTNEPRNDAVKIGYFPTGTSMGDVSRSLPIGVVRKLREKYPGLRFEIKHQFPKTGSFVEITGDLSTLYKPIYQAEEKYNI